MTRILFVEDELAVLDTLQRFFTREGFFVYTARSQSEALKVLEQTAPDITVLDVMLNEGPEPEHDGFEISERLVEAGYKGPIIFVTARASEEDKLKGFERGADDYVTKPFSMLELKARIEAVLRRTGAGQSVYRYGNVEVDLDNYLIRRPGHEERLSNREQELLRYLIDNKHKVLGRDILLTSIWKYSANVTTRTVDTHILNVRKKLGDDANNPQFIETMHGVGYRFVANED